MARIDEAIFCKFRRNKIAHREVMKIEIIYSFTIIKLCLIYIYPSILLRKCTCLQIEISFLNEAEHFCDRCNTTVENIDKSCDTCVYHKLATVLKPETNLRGSQNDTAVHGALSTENNRNEAFGTNRIDIEISGEKRKQDWFLPESDAIKTTLYGISGQCETYNERISYDEEMQPLDLSSKKKQKTTDLSEFENKEWIKRTHTSIIFEYSDKFLIQNKYFNKYIDLELNHVKYNITDLTKTNVDAKTFEIFLFVLRFGYDKKCMNLKFDGFITFLHLFYDLHCYAETDVILNFYKSLLTCLIIFMNDISIYIHIETPKNILSMEKYLFLPFLNVLFDKVEVKFNKNTNELSFLKRESKINLFLFEKNEIVDIYIRLTPEVIILLETESKHNLTIFYWLMSLFKISGIKISHDNIYYSECQEKAKDCKYENIAQELPSCELQLCELQILESIISRNNEEIKFLELERVNISKSFLSYIRKFVKIEFLVFYNCKIPAYSLFLGQLDFLFPNLKSLKINYALLTTAFFKSLLNLKIESLDLSWSTFNDTKSKDLESSDGINTLCELKLDNSCLGYNVIRFLVKSSRLEFLSLKNINFLYIRSTPNFSLLQKKYRFLDISQCVLNSSFMNFYSSNFKVISLSMQGLNWEDLLEMLTLDSLHVSTKALDLSKCCLNSFIIECLKKFQILESIKLSGSLRVEDVSLDEEYPFREHLISIDISDTKFLAADIVFLNQFEFLKELILARCNLKEGFMSIILINSLYSSLEKLDISGNQFGKEDFYLLSQIKNLEYLSITLENSIFRNSPKENNLMFFTKLNTLILTKSVVTYEIFQFINQQYLLTHLHFKDCTFEIYFSSISITSSLKHLNHIVLINPSISSDNMRKFEDLIIYEITVIVQ
ncbi:hypothetical protein CWI37_0437p0020 [Hamiltosporidium tvaerminnensis]|uniref:Uncharacterized protein n=1 Tax=Hamiltosporidium tvaerminnensis TaxID=1176355 RepID=A0A4Q9L526_9MICR|nr:hypothetical protein CWI37_0437p0020 [Hamiltosporidium tvaerminnensis]